MTHHELEQVLRRALRSQESAEDFGTLILARLSAAETARKARDPAGAVTVSNAGAATAARGSRRGALARWVPVALAACLIAAFGWLHWRQQAMQRQRGLEARTQLVQALTMASAYVDAARTAVIRAEDPRQ